MQTPQPGSATPAPTPSAPPDTIPLATSLAFVLDGSISSNHSKGGETVRAHLKRPLLVGTRTVAPAGTPVDIRILDAVPAENPDIYGYVDIYFGPLTLPNGSSLPLRAPTAKLSVNPSAGHEATVGVENTVGDIFMPTALLHMLRKGRNFTLQPGAEIHALTEANVVLLPNGTVAVTTPAPLVLDEATPHSSFNSAPLATPNPRFRPSIVSTPLTPTTPHPR